MKQLLAIAAACAALAACAHKAPPQPKMVFIEVPLPVAAPCVGPDVPGPQTYADTPAALIASLPDQGNFLLQQEWFRRDARLNFLEALVAACR